MSGLNSDEERMWARLVGSAQAIKLFTESLAIPASRILLGGLTDVVLLTHSLRELSRHVLCDLKHVCIFSEPEFSSVKWGECPSAHFKV